MNNLIGSIYRLRKFKLLVLTLFLMVELLNVTASSHGLAQAQQIGSTPALVREIFLTAEDGRQPVQLAGFTDRRDVVIPLPNRAVLTDNAYMELRFTHSSLLLPETSNLTVLLNERPISSLRLDAGNSKDAVWQVTIPAGTQPVNGQISLGLSASMHTNDLLCPPSEDRATWLSFTTTSRIHLEYTLTPVNILSDVIPALFSSKSLLDRRINVVVPATPSARDLSRASEVISRLGSLAGFEGLDIALTYGAADGKLPNTHLIMVGGPALYDEFDGLSLPVELGANNSGFVENDKPVPAETGVIQLTSRNSYLVLIMSGGSDAAVDRAVQAMLDDRGFNLFRGNYALIQPDSVYVPDTTANQARSGQPILANGRNVFNTLGYDTQTVNGVGLQSVNYFFTLPSGSKIDGDGMLTLDYSFSSLSDARRSSLTIVLNDVSIQAIPLTSSTASRGANSSSAANSLPISRNIVTLPKDALRSGDNQLTLRFGLYVARELNSNPCETVVFNDLWGTIYKTSEIQIPTAPAAVKVPTLEQVPFPYVGSSNPSLIALPEQPSAAQLKLAAQLISEFGRHNSPGQYNRFVLVQSEQITEDQIKQNNLVLLGTPDTNRWLKEVNPKLPVSWNASNTRTLVTQRGLRLSFNGKGLNALVEAVASPWNSRLEVLAVMTDPAVVDSEGLISILGRKLFIGKLSGNVLVLDEVNKAYAFNTLEPKATEPVSVTSPTKAAGAAGLTVDAAPAAVDTTPSALISPTAGGSTTVTDTTKSGESPENRASSSFLLILSGVAIFLVVLILAFFMFTRFRRNRHKK